MSGFSLNSGYIRGDLFKESGKWGYTVCIDMSDWYFSAKNPTGKFLVIHECVVEAFWNTPVETLGVNKGTDRTYWNAWTLVVLEPYHEYSHPVLVKL